MPRDAESRCEFLASLVPIVIGVSEAEIVDERGAKNRSQTQREVPSRVVLVGAKSRRRGGIWAKLSGTKGNSCASIEQQESPEKLLLAGTQLMIDARQ